MFLCALTTYCIVNKSTLLIRVKKVFIYSVFIIVNGDNYMLYVGGRSMMFLTNNNESIVILIISGIFSYYHYHFIIKAFEHSSSTVILPFL